MYNYIFLSFPNIKRDQLYTRRPRLQVVHIDGVGRKPFFYFSLSSLTVKKITRKEKKKNELESCVCVCLCTRTAAAYKQRAAREKNPHTDLLYLFLDSADVFGVRGAW